MMRKRLLAIVTVLALPITALADGTKNTCMDLETQAAPYLTASALTTNRTFTFTQPNGTASGGFWPTLDVWFTLVDANASITRLDWTCTGSTNDNDTAGTPLDCSSVTSGVSTCVPTGVWRQQASAGVGLGSGTYHFPIDISKSPDLSCTESVGAGSATASIDTIKIWRRVCVQ